MPGAPPLTSAATAELRVSTYFFFQLSSGWANLFYTTGHLAKDCKANRKFDLNHIADLMPDEAWANMKTASDGKEIQEFREV